MAELMIETGTSDPTRVALGERPLIVGRSPDVDLQIADNRLSRRHCRVELQGQKLLITDLGSSNGTFARGQRITRMAIEPGESFSLGKTRVIFLDTSTSKAFDALPPPRPPLVADFVEPTDRYHPPSAPAQAEPAAPPTPSSRRETHRDEFPELTIEGYQVFEKFAEGSMGSVYAARNLETGERCVLKTVRFDGSAKDAIFFIREAQMGVKLRHPNIVSVLDFGEAGGLLFLAMEYVDGGSLLDRIKRDGPLGNQSALEQLTQLASALDYASKKKFVHRDVKPANILFTRAGIPKLADFGLAKMMAQPGDMALTHAGESRGTPIYMPPELIAHAASADVRADIYSLGATYYHAITGSHPFRAASVIEILRLVTDCAPQPIEERNPRAHPRLIEVISRMMRKKREERFQTAEELGAELRRIAPDVSAE